MIDRARRGLLAAGLAWPFTGAAATAAALETRPIPHSGERIPIVGIGTAVVFDFENDPAKQAERREVVRELVAGGGSVIDTAAAYGHAEERLGEIVAALGVRARLFLATKFSYREDRAGASESLRASLQRLKTDRVDLMQAWNVGDAGYALDLPREWKREGLCRYVGVTTSSARQYEAIARVVAREKPDFLQVNYSLGDRGAEDALLPVARDAGAAVLINLPFGRNSLFRKARGRALPDFAAEFGATSWAQLFLKFILSHPAVTAVIPGTDKPEYILDNLQAGRGPLPDASMRRRIAQYWDALG